MGHFERIINVLGRWLNYVASGAIVIMMILVVIDIILRNIGSPIIGVYEIVGYLGALVIAFALVQLTANEGNISISFLVSKLSKRTQAITDITTNAICAAVCFFISIQGVIYSTSLWHSGQISGCLRIHYFPFMYAIAFIFVLVGLAFVINLLKLIRSVAKK